MCGPRSSDDHANGHLHDHHDLRIKVALKPKFLRSLHPKTSTYEILGSDVDVSHMFSPIVEPGDQIGSKKPRFLRCILHPAIVKPKTDQILGAQL